MARKDIIMATQEELRRLHIIKKVLEQAIIQEEARDLLGLSLRQIRRIIKKVKERGDVGIVHALRGKRSNRGFSQELRDKIIRIYKTEYNDFGPTFAAEKLLELKGIKVSEETLRQWFIKEALPYKKRKSRGHRQWRERKSQFGRMIQLDGSQHDWFEGRCPKCVFMGYIDDATSIILGQFYEYEGTIPALASFKLYIKKYGIPLSVYSDKHTTYKSTAKATIEDELNNRKPLSQFGRALQELGVRIIYAQSPQAKGRVERLFNTLQDRLVKEMRLKGISSIESANEFLKEYLPKHNEKFSVEAGESGDLHRQIPNDLDIDGILCLKTERTLRKDFTISYEGRIYQIEDRIRGDKIMIQESVDGKMSIKYKGKELKFKEIKPSPIKDEEKVITSTVKKAYIASIYPAKIYKSKLGGILQVAPNN